jgi:hypothetical protein
MTYIIGWINGRYTVGMTGVFDHPLAGLAYGALAYGFRSVFFPELENAIHPQKNIAPSEAGTIETKFQLLSVNDEKLL